jgi:tRNA threonylcarbamoyladenosine biosynthesis protein TsaE
MEAQTRVTDNQLATVWTADGPPATLRFASSMGESLRGGEVIALVGPLGAGKTLFVRGLAAGNAACADTSTRQPEVTSPTFTLVNEYEGGIRLFHLDVYRLMGEDDLLALGFDEMCSPTAAVVMEWADRVRDVLPADALWIEIEPVSDQVRRLHVQPGGQTSRALVQETLSRVGAARP